MCVNSDIKTVRDHLAMFEDLCTTFPILGSLLPYLVKDKRVKTMQIHVIAKFVRTLCAFRSLTHSYDQATDWSPRRCRAFLAHQLHPDVSV